MADSAQKSVLVIEDNELNMKLFRDLLQAFGYQTIECEDGVAAMELARSHRPDLIIMDIQLPEISGLDITRWLKDDPELQAIPILAVTAFAMRADEQRVRAAGCEAYLSKPIQISSFMRTVGELMEKAAA